MKGSSYIVPGVGALLIAILVIQSIFGGADIQGSKARDRDGYLALDRLLQKTDLNLKGYRLGFSAVDEATIYLIHEGKEFTRGDWKEAQRLLGEEGILILSGLPDDEELLKAWNLSAEKKEDLLIVQAPLNEGLHSKTSSEEYLLTAENENIRPIIAGDSGSFLALELEQNKGRVILFTDPDFLRNGRLLENDHAVMVQRFFSSLPALPLYYYSQPEKRSYQGMQVFTRGALGLLCLQLLVLALLAAWNRAIRVGPPDEYTQDYRREIHEHLQAVGRLYSQTEKWSMMGRMERRFFESKAARYLHAPHKYPDSIPEKDLKRALAEVNSLQELKESTGAQKHILHILNDRKRGEHGNT